jgi:hypothetical protein
MPFVFSAWERTSGSDRASASLSAVSILCDAGSTSPAKSLNLPTCAASEATSSSGSSSKSTANERSML